MLLRIARMTIATSVLMSGCGFGSSSLPSDTTPTNQYPLAGYPSGIASAASEDLTAIGLANGRLLLLDASGHADSMQSKPAKALNYLACSPTGTKLLAADRTGNISIIDVHDDKILATTKISKAGQRIMAVFTPDDVLICTVLAGETKILSINNDGAIRINDSALSAELSELKPTVVDASIDGSFALFANNTDLVVVDCRKLSVTSRIHCGGKILRKGAISVDGQRAITVGSDIRIWDVMTNTHEILPIPVGPGFVDLLATSRDFSLVAISTKGTVHSPGEVSILKLNEAQVEAIQRIEVPSRVLHLWFSPDKQRLRIAEDNVVTEWLIKN